MCTTWICIFLINRWLRMIACFARSNNRIITSSKQYVLILNKELYIIWVKFCPDNSQFVFQIHKNGMLLFRIVVISYVFHLFLWFILTHWQYHVRNVYTNYMYLCMNHYFGHFDWYNLSYQLKEPLQYSSFSKLHDQCIWLAKWWWWTYLRRSTFYNWWANLSQLKLCIPVGRSRRKCHV